MTQVDVPGGHAPSRPADARAAASRGRGAARRQAGPRPRADRARGHRPRARSGAAPGTTANFLRYVDAGHYDGGTFHRTVKMDNQPESPVKIEVIQAGVNADRAKDGFPAIPLERTSVTGLAHKDGAVSMARGAPDSATSGWFICINDQPSLDFGGAAQPGRPGLCRLRPRRVGHGRRPQDSAGAVLVEPQDEHRSAEADAADQGRRRCRALRRRIAPRASRDRGARLAAGIAGGSSSSVAAGRGLTRRRDVPAGRRRPSPVDRGAARVTGAASARRSTS